MRLLVIFMALNFVLFAENKLLAADGDIIERQFLPGQQNATVILERVIYESDALKIQGFLAYPRNAAEADKPLPCLMFNRGGNRDRGELTPESFAQLGAIAAWGYVVFASNYRGSTGSDGEDEFGGADVNDVVNGLRVFDQLDFADGERIGMWGFSRGALMTYLAMLRTDRVDAAICASGFSDMFALIERRPEMETMVLSQMIPEWEENSEEALAARSPIRRVDDLPDDVPMLLMHGTADWRGHVQDSIDMTSALLKARRPCRLVLFEGADHGLSEHQTEYQEQARRWLDRFVRDQEKLPDLNPHGR